MYYNLTDTDTLQVCYQVQQPHCGSLFAPFELYYRGRLITRIDRGALLEATIIK